MGTVTTLPRSRPLTRADRDTGAGSLPPEGGGGASPAAARQTWRCYSHRSTWRSPTCESYWVVDPLEPAITAWWLRDDAYIEVAHVIGADSFAAQHPFAVDVVPAELVAD